MSDLNIDTLSKRYGRLSVLQAVSLHIENGEFVTLVGPSGCGKSTLLRIVAGLEPFESGDVRLNGRSISSLAPKDRDVAMVFQEYSLYPHLNVRENLSFALKVRGIGRSERESRVAEAARLLQIEHLLEKSVRKLSGGQKQRVAIGRAIVRKPKLFLFDEPLSNLDAKLRSDMRRELKALHQTLRVTTLYVTHDQLEAMSLSDRMAVLNEGRIEQIGTPTEIYSRPQSLFVAAFVGYPPINTLPLTIRFDPSAPPIELQLEQGEFLTSLDTLHSWNGRRVTLGIRPEDVVWRARATEGLNLFTARIHLSEPSGPLMTVEVDLPHADRFLVQTAVEEVSYGRTIMLGIPLARIHLFDESGSRIDLGDLRSYGSGLHAVQRSQ